MKTKTLVFTAPNSFEVQSVEPDDLGPNDILVKTIVTAISPGTERWTLKGLHVGTRFPCVPGYHRIGIIEKKGLQVRGFETGDIVYGSGGRWRDKNLHCMFGAHTEYSVFDAGGYSFVASEMPEQFELDTTVFTILAGVAHRGIRFLNPQPFQQVGIIGSGIIGICAAQLALLRGATPWLLDVDQERLSFVRSIVPNICNIREENAFDNLKKNIPGGFDIVYDSVGNAKTTDRLVQLMRNQGTLLLQAQYFDKEKCALDLDQIKIKEITIKTTCGIDGIDHADTMKLIRTRQLAISQLITHRFKSADIKQGYELLRDNKEFNLGIVFNWR